MEVKDEVSDGGDQYGTGKGEGNEKELAYRSSLNEILISRESFCP